MHLRHPVFCLYYIYIDQIFEKINVNFDKLINIVSENIYMLKFFLKLCRNKISRLTNILFQKQLRKNTHRDFKNRTIEQNMTYIPDKNYRSQKCI